MSIEDLGSTNGTFVNDARLDPFHPTDVCPGDQILVGTCFLPPGWEARLAASTSSGNLGPLGAATRRISIGRSEDNDIILDFPQISNEHAWLSYDHGQWVLEDRGSTNHTFVNDRSRTITRQVILPEDSIYFGSYKIPARRLLEMDTRTVLGRSNPVPIVLRGDDILIGRDPRATIHLDYPQISWHHARLRRRNGALLLEDLNSSNGTYVNGRRITSCQVSSGLTISLGSFNFKLTADLKLVKRDFRRDIQVEARGLTMRVPDRKAAGSVKTILNEVSLTVHPSEFVGLMGPSGAGKTTLLKALIGYQLPHGGDCLINGVSLYDNYDMFRHLIGYVPQDDIIHAELTVFEALYYAAKIRLPEDTTDEEIRFRIDSVLAGLGLLDLEAGVDLRHTLIGSPEKQGLSGGQKKRVNLAMELLTDPGLFFLDEPCSGLSSEDTLVVMDLLKNLANQGKTVIMTLHQPGLEAYKKMDSIIFLTGGRLAFFGPAYPDSINYFNPDLPPDDVKHNPDHALAGLARGEKQNIDWPRQYAASRYFRQYVSGRAPASKETGAEPSNFLKVTRQPNWSQWWALTRRYLVIKSRDAVNTAILLVQAPLIAALVSLVFHGDKPPLLVPLFFLTIAALWFGASNSMREIVGERAIFTRERMVSLKIPSYLLSKYAVLGLLSFLQCLMMVTICKTFLEVRSPFLLILAVLTGASLAGLSIGLFVSSITKTQQQAVAVIPIVLLFMVILGGGTIHIKDMNTPTLVISFLTPSRWAYEGMIHAEEEGRKREEAAGKRSHRKVSELMECQESLVECLYGTRRLSPMVLAGGITIFAMAYLLGSMLALKRRDLL